jgi:hypothetical protein
MLYAANALCKEPGTKNAAKILCVELRAWTEEQVHAMELCMRAASSECAASAQESVYYALITEFLAVCGVCDCVCTDKEIDGVADMNTSYSTQVVAAL